MRSIHLSPADSQIFRICRILYAWGSSQILKEIVRILRSRMNKYTLEGFLLLSFLLTIFFFWKGLSHWSKAPGLSVL
jgi:hypothetical protein